ncbi:sugar ABC transporter substrate-binding protein [Pendulispora albinea]|uniref:Substrate-binding domain-containing protein n=1 Tax=Pendulispora albinea TaxID=2741071 RepID=A0ABZ2LQE0_9BACT
MNTDFDSAAHRRMVTKAIAAVSVLFGLACKSGDPPVQGDAGIAAPASVSAATVDPAILAYAQHQIDLAYAGTDRDPPTSAPRPTPGKNVWIISPSEMGDSASVATNAAKQAGEAVGWKMTLYDAKGDPSNFSNGLRQAIAAKADGVILHAIDCAWVKQPLVEARAAHVKTVAYLALDCDDPSVKGEPLYSGMVNFGSQFGDYATLTRAWAAVKADWVIVQTQGHAKVLQFRQDELLVLKYIREGFEQELAKCKSCEVVKSVDFTISDWGPKLRQKAQGALLQHPEANAIHSPYDTPMLLGIASAIVDSGRNDQLAVIAGEAFPSNVQLIRDNKGQDAANAYPAEWMGYAAVDSLNSVFHGQKPQYAGIGYRLLDREHNMPALGKGYEPSRDFRAAYRRAWGLSR